MSLVPVSLPIARGTNLYNKYQPLQLIGRGSFGEVWLAKDHALNHQYAIKVLNSGIDIDQRLREAQVGHAFTHNNLVRVHQADVATDGKVIIAMDFLPDGSITTLANAANFLPVPTAVRVMIDVLQGLEHLHSSDFFHNDIKPENILRGPQGQALLGDYGIVGVSTNGNPVLPVTWYVLHAAPEMVAGGGIEARTDIFQAGLTMYRLLAGLGILSHKFNSLGRSAYEAAIAGGSLITTSDFPPFLPSAICRIVLKAISPSQNARFQSALEMRRALEKLSFPGYWTVDVKGELAGNDRKYTYRFEHTMVSKSSYSFTALKTNIASKRETRISEFSSKNLTKAEARKTEVNFIKAVVQGKIA
jgi:serine/threonine protein kinase